MLTKLEQNIIYSQLELFGCTLRESRVYLDCLTTGSSSVQQIAKRLDENRVTIHSAVEQLLKKGLLFETRKGKRRLIGAEDPSSLGILLQTKENDLKVLKDNLSQVTNILKSVKKVDANIPTIELLEDVEGFKKMLELSLEARNEFLAIINVQHFSELVHQKYLKDYFTRRAKKNIYSRLIFPVCDFGYEAHKRSKEFKIQVRMLPEGVTWSSGMNSWNNMISIMSFTHGKLACTVIQNDDIAFFYRNVVFEAVWAQAEIVK